MRFRGEALARIRAHARRRSPEECCGLLVGASQVERAVPAVNRASDPGQAYLVDPRFHLAQELKARRLGQRVLGFYHSHPGQEARPSTRDTAEAHPGYIYLIVGGLPPEGGRKGGSRGLAVYQLGPQGWRSDPIEEVP